MKKLTDFSSASLTNEEMKSVVGGLYCSMWCHQSPVPGLDPTQAMKLWVQALNEWCGEGGGSHQCNVQ
jgi:natural product precursor